MKSSWFTNHSFSEYFQFRKEQLTLQEFSTENLFDVIYYDAFDPKAQPELWTEEILQKIAAQTRTRRRISYIFFQRNCETGAGRSWF